MPALLIARRSALGLLLLLLSIAGCGSKVQQQPSLTRETPWEEILRQAKGQTVNMAMWDGDPMINAYMRDYVAPELQKQFGITFKPIGGQGNTLVSKLLVDLEAGRKSGDIDLMWINGETFYQLRKMKALYGPFTQQLPNNQYLDWDNPFVSTDFQQPVEGYECPWGNVQLALIYDSDSVPSPPQTRAELTQWIKDHPGRFTFDNSFTGLTFLKSLLIDFAGGPGSLDGPFDEAKYKAASEKLWTWLREVQPQLWREGKTFPESVADLHKLLSNKEVDFSMSNNDGEVDNKVTQGVLPQSARAYVLKSGTIRNSHFLGIPHNAPNKAAALVLANFLISPEAQLRKAQPEVWGDGTVLSSKRLSPEWSKKFSAIEGRTRVPPRDELEKQALMEPSSEIMVRLHEDFRREIIQRGQ